MKVSAQYAEEHFADLAAAAALGEEVEIACANESSFRLTLVQPAVPATPRRPRSELWGAWEGLVTMPTQEEWDEIHREFLGTLPDAFDPPEKSA